MLRYVTLQCSSTKVNTDRMTSGTQEMLGVFDVNGETTEASASDNEMPVWAVRRAPQSLAPSPHIPTYRLKHTQTQTD